MDKKKTPVTSLPFYLYLLPLFFVFHGFNEYFYLVPVSDALPLVFRYTAFGAIGVLLFWLLFRSFRKATLVSFLLQAFTLFFGSIHDFFKDQFPGSFIVRYSFIAPFVLVLVAVLVVYVKKTKSSFLRVTRYLNILFLVLLALELFDLSRKLPYEEKPLVETIRGDTRLAAPDPKPDIYLIMADEYAGKKELTDLFHYDNSRFYDSLRTLGFHLVENAKSNYNWTIYSIASMLNLQYLQNLKQDSINSYDMMQCTDAINDNNVVQMLKEGGYELYNCSIFDIRGHIKQVHPAFLPDRITLISASILPNRLRRDIGFNFVEVPEINYAKKMNLRNNTRIEQMTKEIIAEKSSHPRFVYAHLVMPHYQYFFDSTGKPMPDSYLEEETRTDKNAYINYMGYTNKKLLELANLVLHNNARPAVILIMGDHGFRALDNTVDHSYHFMTLNAVYMPDGDYSGFYEGMPNINQFRVVLNKVLGQRFPMLKDSSIFIKGY